MTRFSSSLEWFQRNYIIAWWKCPTPVTETPGRTDRGFERKQKKHTRKPEVLKGKPAVKNASQNLVE
jgi:hypothetical protein